MNAVANNPAGAVPAKFPSLEWFQNLADLMNGNRARAEQLGYVDCIARFTVTRDGKPLFCAQITFDEFEVLAVTRGTARNADKADFELKGELADWAEMIDNIRDGGGKPDLEHTLNRLSHIGTPFLLVQDDPMRRDMYFRYNQSLQEFFNASAQFETLYDQ
ncbi:MAG: hypothetical protein OEZ23_09040 [Gammaproteobacteria bacterium]|nr:hypothetical protein [Gammaproteobacteria bacterium]